jgi:polysaccharide pyruvyl transferase CsaB
MAMANPVYRIGISGSYGGLNLGDEAILRSMCDQLRRDLPVEITVFSRNPEDTLARHDVERALPVRELSRQEVLPELKRLDLLLLGGGGILFDAEASIYLREATLAHELGVPVMLYAIGAGPLQDPAAQRVVRQALERAAVVTVRERAAQKALEEAGVKREIIVTADPALLLEPEPLPEHALRREGLDRSHRLIGVSVREPGVAAPDIDQSHYHDILANAADYMVDRLDADLVFVPMEPHVKDTQQAHSIISRMAKPKRATVLRGEYTSGQLLSLMDHFAFAVGMRLHFLIFAALRGVPFVALPYATKVTGLLDSLGVRALPLQQVKAGQIIAHIDRSWDLRDELQRRITKMLPALQARARENNRIAVSLLEVRAPTQSAI